MLAKKMFREIRGNVGQFLSVLLLSALALMLYTAFKSEAVGGILRQREYNEETNRADGWLYSEGFTAEQIEKVRGIKEVNDAMPRFTIDCETADYNQAQVILYAQDDNIVSKPYIVEGSAFDPKDKEHIWINKQFATEWNIDIGDELELVIYGSNVSKKVAGFIYSAEHIYIKADKDADTNYKNIMYAYVSREGIDMLSDVLYSELLITSDVKDVMSLESKISKALEGNYSVFVDEEAFMGIRSYMDEMKQHNGMSYVFSGIFVLVSIFIIMTTMRRIVDSQRTQIGTLSALGMKDVKIVLHYMGYSAIPSVIGAVAGLLIGPQLMKNLMFLLTNFYTIPGWKPTILSEFYVVALVVVLACVLSSFFSCKRLLKVEPAKALRPAPPKEGKNIIFEKFPFWNKLGFTSQYDLRDISRSKMRTAMCLVGIIFGTAFALAAFFSLTTLDKTEEWSFERLSNYEYQVSLQKGTSLEAAEKIALKYDGEMVAVNKIEIATKKNSVSKDRDACALVVCEGKNLYGITGNDTQNVSLKPGYVALTKKLAKKYGLGEGDTFYLHIYGENTWYTVKLGVINRHPNVPGVTMLREDFEKLAGQEFTPNQILTQNEVDSEELLADENVLSVYDKADMEKTFDDSWSTITGLVGFFVTFAIFFIIIVLYNAGNLSFNERKRELATLRVLGLSDMKITMLLVVQNLWLTVVGVLLGTFIGKFLIVQMFDTNGDQYDYAIFTKPLDYIKSYGIVLVTSLIVSFLFSGKVKKIDMVEQLKSNE